MLYISIQGDDLHCATLWVHQYVNISHAKGMFEIRVTSPVAQMIPSNTRAEAPHAILRTILMSGSSFFIVTASVHTRIACVRESNTTNCMHAHLAPALT